MHYLEEMWRKNLRTPRRLEGELKKDFRIWWGDVLVSAFIYVSIIAAVVLTIYLTWPKWK